MTMVDYIGEAAMYEQFAEEATELAKAALKMARVIRQENPTPVTREKAKHMVSEEFTDVIQCSLELGVTADRDQMEQKRQRFLERIYGVDSDEDIAKSFIEDVRAVVDWLPQGSEDERIDSQKYFICCPLCDNERCVKDTADCKAEQWAKKLREQTGWISVEDSLPMIGEDVLVCDLDGDIHISYLRTDDSWGFDDYGNRLKNIVAWMPLPKRYEPQESEDENN